MRAERATEFALFQDFPKKGVSLHERKPIVDPQTGSSKLRHQQDLKLAVLGLESPGMAWKVIGCSSTVKSVPMSWLQTHFKWHWYLVQAITSLGALIFIWNQMLSFRPRPRYLLISLKTNIHLDRSVEFPTAIPRKFKQKWEEVIDKCEFLQRPNRGWNCHRHLLQAVFIIWNRLVRRRFNILFFQIWILSQSFWRDAFWGIWTVSWFLCGSIQYSNFAQGSSFGDKDCLQRIWFS